MIPKPGNQARSENQERAPRAATRRLPAALVLLVLIASGSCSDDEHPPGLSAGTAGEGTGVAGAAGAGGAGGVAGATGVGGSALAGTAAAGGSAGSGEPLACIPRAECQRLCAVLSSDGACGLGDASECGCNCEARFNVPCPDELDDLLACAGDTPDIDCAERGRVFAGCENESFALDLCDFQSRGELCAEQFPPCTPFCRGALLASCDLGPESVSSCLCGCEQSYATQCATEFAAFMDCTSNEPAFACDDAGRVTAALCEPEWQALDVCSRSPADAGD